MSKLISGYLWAWTKYEAGLKSVNSLKKFYHDSDIFINVVEIIFNQDIVEILVKFMQVMIAGQKNLHLNGFEVFMKLV